MTYEETIDWLYGLQTFGIKLGLGNMQKLAGALKLPDEKQKVLHVAGTNGKGSVCAMIDSICRAAGMRTGLFTSPHLIHYRERIRLDGEMISEERVIELAGRIRSLCEDWEPHPTFFEITLAIALEHFRGACAEVVVLETGMGGRLDATNALRTDLSVITPIGFDHQKWLGNSLAEIAGEKAGIIRPGVPVVSAKQASEARAVLESAAPDLAYVEDVWAGPVGLAGAHQRENAALAAEAIRRSELGIPEPAIGEGIASVRWRARFERVGNYIIDGAHNNEGAAAFVATWREEFGEEKATIIFGSVEAKDIPGMLRELSKIAGHFVLTTVNSPRGVPSEQLAELLPEETSYELCVDTADAFEKTCDLEGTIAVVGSLFLAGEFLTLVEEAANTFEPSIQ